MPVHDKAIGNRAKVRHQRGGNVRGTVLLVMIFGVVSMATAQYDHCNCTCKGSPVTTCVPIPSSGSCKAACTTAACGGVGSMVTNGDHPLHGPCPVTIIPETYEMLVKHVKHTIDHQGASLWTGSNQDDLIEIVERRRRLVETAGNGDFQHRGDFLQAVYGISNATAPDLEKATQEGLQACYAEF